MASFQQLNRWLLRRLYDRGGSDRLRHDEALRLDLCERLLVVNLFCWEAFTALLLFGVLGGARYWIVDFELLAAILISAWGVRHRRYQTGATLLLVVYCHLAMFATLDFGLVSPAPALFPLAILTSGVLLGRRALVFWALFLCAMIVATLFLSPVNDGATRFAVLFWCLASVATAWLTGLLGRQLERAVQLSRGQTGSLARILEKAAAEPEDHAMRSEIEAAVAEQFAAARALLLPADAADVDDGERLLTVDERERLGFGAAQTVLLLPLRTSGRTLSVLAIVHDDRHNYSPDDLDLAQLLARQAALAILLLETSERRSGEAVLEERNRIARDIHDSLAQGLTGIVVQLNAAEEALGRGDASAQGFVDTARGLARTSLQEARRSIWALRPDALERDTLPVALERLAREMTSGAQIDIDVSILGTAYPLSLTAEQNLLRIGQEALQNALKHAAPRRIRVCFEYASDSLTLTVEDAPGISADTVHSGLGMRTMRERTEELGGTFTFDLRSGEGARVRVTIPS